MEKDSKKHMKVISVLLFFFISTAYAFNWEVCKKEWIKDSGTLIVGSFMISSTQFTSSWGSCSALKTREDERQHFVAINFENLKIDLARGQGGFIDSYARLYNCTENDTVELKNILRNNYKNIFGPTLELNSEEFYLKANTLLKNNYHFIESCKFN